MDRSEIDRRPSYSYHPRSPSCSPPPQSSVDSWWTEEPFAKGHTLRSPAGASEELQGGKQPQTWTDSEEGDKRIKHPVFKRPYYTDRTEPMDRSEIDRRPSYSYHPRSPSCSPPPQSSVDSWWTEEPFAKGHTLRSPAGASDELQGGKQPQTWTDSEEGDKRIKHPVFKRPYYTDRTMPRSKEGKTREKINPRALENANNLIAKPRYQTNGLLLNLLESFGYVVQEHHPSKSLRKPEATGLGKGN
ncbi:uncharacterized protein LOC124358475 [Homalodisca vitripennis]|uniref:uncharacterized protein LOC124358475 n=1 Tax=Homalodisca vitripennis TaxID=197043 RepID=UPI001EEB254D|nr:uncharacterized protein LOC124358475 [Homalodisca vitripennis]